MRFDPQFVLNDRNGQAIPDGEKSFTLGAALATALLFDHPDEANLSGEEKMKRFKLALSISNGNGEVSIEEAALLKSVAAKAFGTLVMGRIWEALDEAASAKTIRLAGE